MISIIILFILIYKFYNSLVRNLSRSLEPGRFHESESQEAEFLLFFLETSQGSLYKDY